MGISGTHGKNLHDLDPFSTNKKKKETKHLTNWLTSPFKQVNIFH